MAEPAANSPRRAYRARIRLSARPCDGHRCCRAIVLLAANAVMAEDWANAPASLELPESLLAGPESWTSPEGSARRSR